VVAGITCMTAYQGENIRLMRVGETAHLAGYTFTLTDVSKGTGPNYDFERGTFDVEGFAGRHFAMTPERRFYPVRSQTTTQAAISTSPLWNLYVSFGEANGQGQYAVRLYFHPLVAWIWSGALLMALGGALSLSDRRLRIGMPQQAPARAGTVAAE